MNKTRLFRSLKWFLAIFILMNVFAFYHAYEFTHFDEVGEVRTSKPEELSFLSKISVLFMGVSNPRPINEFQPNGEFQTIVLDDGAKTEAWWIEVENSKGCVIVCHGYGGSKSKMLDRAEAFNEMGYSTFLIDFMGSGGSAGNATSIGYYESDQVRASTEYLKAKGEENIILFGSSMGSVAIMKAMKENELDISSTIIECPFSSLHETIKSRFTIMHVPSFPLSELLTFWGGIQNGYWAFDFNPKDYAKEINTPVLLMIGLEDQKVSLKETKDIFQNLSGPKKLVTFENTEHENYLKKNELLWSKEVSQWMSKYSVQ